MLYSFDDQLKSRLEAKLSVAEKTDEQLMSGVKAGDQSALELLYQRHAPLLRTVIGRVLNNDADTEDLLQEAFVEVWKQSRHYCEDKGKVLGWMVTLARRRAIDRLRKNQAYSRAGDRLREETERESEIPLPHRSDEAVVAADIRETFTRLLSTLPPAQRDALHLAFYQGMSQREIAAHTGIPLGTIKTRLELAVRKMRTAVLALGGSHEWLPSLGAS